VCVVLEETVVCSGVVVGDGAGEVNLTYDL
jgi:hypothetical protein